MELQGRRSASSLELRLGRGELRIVAHVVVAGGMAAMHVVVVKVAKRSHSRHAPESQGQGEGSFAAGVASLQRVELDQLDLLGILRGCIAPATGERAVREQLMSEVALLRLVEPHAPRPG